MKFDENEYTWDAPYFIGVKTIKEYCFPWCKGNPLSENTHLFQTRHEAEQAGFRPCKNCYSGIPFGAWEDHKEVVKIITPKEFSFKENLKYLSRSTNECLFTIVDNKIYRAIPIENESPLVEISAENDTNLTVRFFGHSKPKQKWLRAEVTRYIREWFDLETDLIPFYELAKSDPLLSQPVSNFYGLRNIGIPDLFEALAWGILGQQINLTYAYTLKRRFVELYGRYVDWKGIKYWLFPSLEEIASLSVEDLKDLKMTVKKCEYLIGVAQLLANGQLTKELLSDTGDYKKAEKILVKIRGIGPWTANYVLMRCLRFPSAFPMDDVGLHNSIKLIMKTDKKPSKEEILKLSSTWTNWESYATFYLWRMLY
ncbi:DNA-3-methyladenine glycosylase II [Bacillus pakistanensis]|uniref:DNA-3-methyladenine glycosylase II n=1 Tax=Rossellomorea pakistanensis TaxID=992288 RepID=A0ABS2N6L5_9BACI|nr:Ada metal-binding domain-containing protein [Bacillus pakistanensis]MBM7583493.1 DNA-3-methyladenine glycosylase II [Bacillus pakistanensis]